MGHELSDRLEAKKKQNEATFFYCVKGTIVRVVLSHCRSSLLAFVHLLSNFYYVYLVPVQFDVLNYLTLPLYAGLRFRLTTYTKLVV